MKLPLLLAPILLVLSCSGNAQRGQFAVSDISSQSLNGKTGDVCVVTGNKLAEDGQVEQTDVPLLYLLVECPGVKAIGSGTTSSHSTYISSIDFSYKLTDGLSVIVDLEWDRQSDVLKIGGNSYPRSNGNVLQIVRNQNGTLSSKQLATENSQMTPQQALVDINRTIQEVKPASK